MHQSLRFVFLHTPVAKQEDDELVLQIVYVFHQLVQHNAPRTQIIKESRIHNLIYYYYYFPLIPLLSIRWILDNNCKYSF